MNTRKPDVEVKFWRRRVVVLGAGAGLLLVIGLGLALWLAAPLFAGPSLTRLTVTAACNTWIRQRCVPQWRRWWAAVSSTPGWSG